MSKPASQTFACWLSLVLFSSSLGFSAKNDWAEGSSGTRDGATRDYYNRAGLLPWTNFMGDWRDAKNVAQGSDAYATAMVVDNDRGEFVEWEVGDLLRQWRSGEYQNQGFFLRTVRAGGNIVFASREHPQTDHRPRLVVVGAQGSTTLAAEADTFLTKSTYRSQAQDLRVSAAPDHALLRFDITPLNKLGRISQATLRLYTTRQYGAATIGVFRCQQGHGEPPSEPIQGLAARFPCDRGIGSDADVVFASDFDSPTWNDEWTYAGDMKVIDTWMNVYHGGTQPSPYDQHLFIDNVVIAGKYIGPMLPTAADER